MLIPVPPVPGHAACAQPRSAYSPHRSRERATDTCGSRDSDSSGRAARCARLRARPRATRCPSGAVGTCGSRPLLQREHRREYVEVEIASSAPHARTVLTEFWPDVLAEFFDHFTVTVDEHGYPVRERAERASRSTLRTGDWEPAPYGHMYSRESTTLDRAVPEYAVDRAARQVDDGQRQYAAHDAAARSAVTHTGPSARAVW